MSASTQPANVDPNLRLGLQGSGQGSGRYPSPFFDIAQQYTPPTVKELFKWVYFYATNNSFVGPALRKMARYPITDLILEDPSHSLVTHWTSLLNNILQIKTFNMETNLDLITYGNGFVTIHYPFTRFLACSNCKERYPWKTIEKKVDNLQIRIKCKKCGVDGNAAIIDIPYRSIENLRLIRLNPEYIDIKYNDSTGRHTYLYSIPDKLKRQIMAGDVDILEDTPKIYFDAIRQRKKIKLNSQNLFHLKLPSLAGKDMGWGLPLIAVALKDLFHYYTLRRGQEAVMLEHITPFDIIFPQANGKYDPYVHTDLSNWKRQIEVQLANKRRDPNYKAVLPFPIGYERISGDGKSMMLTPEMDFLAKTIIGSCGIPQEFVFGGNMQWSASSISLRTLENDFLHHRSQILQLDIWLVERLRLYMGIPAPKSIKFSDFKMADDMQRLQLLIGMASNRKLDWDEIYKEMGKDPEVVRQKLQEEARFEAKLTEQDAINQAEAGVRAQQVQMRAQTAMQAEAAENQQAMAEAASQMGGQAGVPSGEQQPGGEGGPDKEQTAQMFAKKLSQQPPDAQAKTIARLRGMDPTFAGQVQVALAQMQAPPPGTPAPTAKSATKPIGGADMRPLPEQRPPRRQGGI